MAWRDPEAKRAYEKAYREANREKRREQGQARYAANRERYLEQSAVWYAANKERVKDSMLAYQAKRYRNDPMYAALRNAKNIIHQQTGIPVRNLDKQIVEAKALQLLVKKAALFPGRQVGEVFSLEERAARRAASCKKWREANKEKRAEYNRAWRAAKKPPTPLTPGAAA